MTQVRAPLSPIHIAAVSEPGSPTWQEADCPHCGVDFDLHDGEMVKAGDTLDCLNCKRPFIADGDTVQQYIPREAD